MKKELDDVALQVMLNNTQYKKQPHHDKVQVVTHYDNEHNVTGYSVAEKETQEHWFSFNNQKQLTFHLAANIYAISECHPDANEQEMIEEAITDATRFVNQFYQQVMNPKSFK